MGCPAGQWIYVCCGEFATLLWLSGPPLAKRRTESEIACVSAGW